MAGGKNTAYGRARRLAYDLWRGPAYIVKPDEDESVGGSCILRLALREGTSTQPQLEARTVYGAFTQQNALLRAISWDSRTITRNSLSEEQQLKLPARFVRLPTARIREWLSAFDQLQTSLQALPPQDDTVPIYSLRIELDSVYSVFEKVWQAAPGETNELQRAWHAVWQQLGQALETYPTVSGVEEHFPCIEGKPEAYDFQAYKTSR